MRCLQVVLVLAAGLAGSDSAAAFVEDCWAVATVASYHRDGRGDDRADGRGYNERNHGLGGECPFNRAWSGALGWYPNSRWEDTYYLGAAWLPWRWGIVRAGAFFGGATGYPAAPIVPMVATMVALEDRHLGVNLGRIPVAKGVWYLQLKVRF